MASEVSTICKVLQISYATKEDVYKLTINKAVKYHQVTELKKDLTGDKLQEMANSDVSERRAYTGWSLLECRMAYRYFSFDDTSVLLSF